MVILDALPNAAITAGEEPKRAARVLRFVFVFKTVDRLMFCAEATDAAATAYTYLFKCITVYCKKDLSRVIGQ